MRKDIDIPMVEGVSLAVVKEMNEDKTVEVFNVYIINLKHEPIESVLVSARGYGENKTTGEQIKTSTLRHFIGDMDGRAFEKIEPIMEEVFGINNEYWVSFLFGGKMFDKKFIFLAESIIDANMVPIPIMEDKKGVII